MYSESAFLNVLSMVSWWKLFTIRPAGMLGGVALFLHKFASICCMFLSDQHHGFSIDSFHGSSHCSETNVQMTILLFSQSRRARIVFFCQGGNNTFECRERHSMRSSLLPSLTRYYAPHCVSPYSTHDYSLQVECIRHACCLQSETFSKKDGCADLILLLATSLLQI